ncbi:bifunctional aminoglycoside phosphotransferase/ATP-binding protein [Chelatococcus reniformis]|uniref:Aminoglycoside phosphotransferase domain-containing protein n=1 Tax=Chelatococcus reniformis TaxID=1494448 RepID=A0A916XEH0_9HYPH|nr:bifunctional aminoglycoside phosphotransferase/ATP-binding protein [Chelatococcus reniformis]GGC65901.1 hypothetical protein GCM10010994_25620 [Chelatococcus reniformis]
MSSLAGSSPHVVADQSEVFAFIGSASTFGLAAPPVRIDTHGAVVVLAGPFVYKVKRAVRFPFLDFSTLAKREAACRTEFAVNAVYAPSIYLGVVSIRRGADGGLRFDGAADGEVVEWAVKMRRFPHDCTLDRVAAAGGLTPALMADLAQVVAASHEAGERRLDPAEVDTNAMYLEQNAEAFAEYPDLFAASRARAIIAAGREAFAGNRGLLVSRCLGGYVRRCHGDLHLRNIVLLGGKPTLFDAIEFDERIATCDLLYDLAFLLMDLVHRGFADQSNLLFNRYLWLADEAHLEGLAALPLFLSIRASIRAKVTAAGLDHLDGAARDREAAEVAGYFDLADSFLAPVPARLVAVAGLSGTGKSTLAGRLAPRLGRAPGAVHLRSDIERKRLFGVMESEQLPPEAYDAGAGEAVYAALARKATAALEAGAAVVVDAVYARAHERAALEAVARNAGVPFAGLWLTAPEDVLVARVEARRGDASDARADTVRAQQRYDTGPIGWSRIDATPTPDRVVAAAWDTLERADSLSRSGEFI